MKTDLEIALEHCSATQFGLLPPFKEKIWKEEDVLAAIAAARADERGKARGGTHCACSFDDNDELMHMCDWHRDQIVTALAEEREKLMLPPDPIVADLMARIQKLENAIHVAKREQHAECVRLLRESADHEDLQYLGPSYIADWLEAQKP